MASNGCGVGSGPGGIFTSRPVSGLRPFNITASQKTRTNVGKRCYRLPTDCRAEYGVGLQHATVRETNAQQRSRQYCPLVTPPRPPPRLGERSTVMSVSVFVCPRSHLLNYTSELHHIFCAYYLWLSRYSSSGVICYVFPVLWMTSYLQLHTS